jgi:hypothetical protein
VQPHLRQLADIEARLKDVVTQLRLQHGLVGTLDGALNRHALALLLANGLRAHRWLEHQHDGLIERIAADFLPPRF